MRHLLIILLAVVPALTWGTIFNDEDWMISQDLDEHIREKRSPAPPPAAPQINYRPYSQAPAQIKQLLQFQQAREPLTHIPAQPVPQLSSGPRPEPQYQTQSQVSQYNPEVKYGATPQQPTYKAAAQQAQYQPAAAAPAPQYTPQYRNAAPQQPQYQPAAQPNFKAFQPAAAPQSAVQPQYSNKLPPQLQQLLQLQAQLPNSIPAGSPQHG